MKELLTQAEKDSESLGGRPSTSEVYGGVKLTSQGLETLTKQIEREYARFLSVWSEAQTELELYDLIDVFPNGFMAYLRKGHEMFVAWRGKLETAQFKVFNLTLLLNTLTNKKKYLADNRMIPDLSDDAEKLASAFNWEWQYHFIKMLAKEYPYQVRFNEETQDWELIEPVI